MNKKTIFKIIIISFLFVNLSIALKRNIENLSWLEIAALSDDKDGPIRGLISDSIIDINLAKKYKVMPKINLEDLICEIPEKLEAFMDKLHNIRYWLWSKYNLHYFLLDLVGLVEVL